MYRSRRLFLFGEKKKDLQNTGKMKIAFVVVWPFFLGPALLPIKSLHENAIGWPWVKSNYFVITRTKNETRHLMLTWKVFHRKTLTIPMTLSITQPAIGAFPLLGKHEVRSANEGQFTHWTLASCSWFTPTSWLLHIYPPSFSWDELNNIHLLIYM